MGPKAYETCIIQGFRKYFYLFIDQLRLCVIYFQSWKVKEWQYLQPRPNSSQGGFKNLKKNIGKSLLTLSLFLCPTGLERLPFKAVNQNFHG